MPDYSHQIEKYLKGELNPSERHALEKEALRDPFLFDALEGAESISFKDFLKDLEYLNSTHRKKQGVYLWPLRIAAGILLIAATTFLIINFDAEIEPLALQTENSPKETGEAPDESPTTEATNETFLSPRGVTAEPEGQKDFDAGESDEGGSAFDEGSIALNELEPQPRSEPRTDESVTPVQPSFAPGESLAKAEVESLADQAPASISQASRASRSAQVMAIVAEEKKISEIIVTPLLPSSLNEVVVTQPNSAAAGEQSRNRNQLITMARPESGLDSFNRFLESNMQYPLQAISNNISGDVQLQFRIDSSGSIQNIRVIQSLGFGCDEEAIRLVRSGPDWLPSIVDNSTVESQVELTIRFNLP